MGFLEIFADVTPNPKALDIVKVAVSQCWIEGEESNRKRSRSGVAYTTGRRQHENKPDEPRVPLNLGRLKSGIP
jgi:hypothetical protein